MGGMMIQSVIFDMDGTITKPTLNFDQIRRDLGFAPDGGDILTLIGEMDSDEQIKAHEILERHERMAIENSSLNNTARHTLETLRDASIDIGILTRNTRKNAIAVAEMHGLVFDAIYAREDGPVKPDSFGVFKLCDAFGTKPAETIVVGDYIDDITCAKSAGATAVLLETHKNAAEFAIFADFAITSLDKILKIIENMKYEV
jgi:HAD superfamily hydrolase (TIGR01509 family)